MPLDQAPDFVFLYICLLVDLKSPDPAEQKPHPVLGHAELGAPLGLTHGCCAGHAGCEWMQGERSKDKGTAGICSFISWNRVEHIFLFHCRLHAVRKSVFKNSKSTALSLQAADGQVGLLFFTNQPGIRPAHSCRNTNTFITKDSPELLRFV